MHGSDLYDPYPQTEMIHITTPAQRLILDDLRKMMKRMTDSEISDYLRSLVNSMIIVSPSTDPMDKIFGYINNEIDRYERDFPLTTSLLWSILLFDLIENSLIRRETLDLQGRVTSWTEETYSLDSRIVETGRWGTYLDGTICIIINRYRYDAWDEYDTQDESESQRICLNSVAVEESEDRYIEKYPRWENNQSVEMETRTIWKRDLWREELHTQPFKAIHEELMYSPYLIGKYENEATKAKKHFDSLR